VLVGVLDFSGNTIYNITEFQYFSIISMKDQIVSLNDRGQFTVPKEDRDTVGTRYFVYRFNAGTITLSPLQTREEFLKELEEAEGDWEKNGGYSLEDMHKRHDV